jgi:UDP-N-acetyl-D-glucosamine dehydrogenase
LASNFEAPGRGTKPKIRNLTPIDPFYLTWKAREYGINTRYIELAGEINSHMPEWVVGKVAEGLNANKKSVNGS